MPRGFGDDFTVGGEEGIVVIMYVCVRFRTSLALVLNVRNRDVVGAVGTRMGWKHTVRIGVREVDGVPRGRVGESRHVCHVRQRYGKAMNALTGLGFGSGESAMCQGWKIGRA